MNTCPRCGDHMREPLVTNALSRLDNKTYVCSQCGHDEAMFNMFRPGVELPPFGELAFVIR